MIDIKLIRENPKAVKESLRKRLRDEKQVDSLLELDKAWREIKKEADDFRARRNEVSEKINQAKKKEQNVQNLIREARNIPVKIQEKEAKLKTLDERRLEIWKNIPNVVASDVPAGDAEKNKVIKKFGKTGKKTRSHVEIMESMGLIDTAKASLVAGSRFYYLKNDLVKLNLALINFSIDFLSKKGLQPVQTPYMLNKKALEGAIMFDVFQEMIYKIEGEDLYLIGTAEHAINAMNSDEVLQAKDLPLRYAGFSTNFRKELGAHGKDTKGIFRVHQFEKIEQFVFCRPEDSWKEFDFLLKNSIEIYKKLGIPFRVVLLAAGEASKTATKTIDLEGWYPSQGKYRELGSCSNCLDYQARRSNIRYQEGNELKFVHTVNNTAIATERMMTCIIENNIQKDGSIKIPSVLHKYMSGKKKIGGKKK